MTHGTRSAYCHAKCRCDQCRLAHADYMAAYLKARHLSGTCARCGKPAQGWRCLRCAEAHAARLRAWRGKHKEAAV